MDEINKHEVFKELKLNQDFITNIKLYYVFKYELIGRVEFNVIIVTNDEKTYVFGHNSKGVLGLGHENEVKELTLNEDLSNKQIIDFKNSLYHTIARTIDGKVYCWGWNNSGLLGDGRNDDEISKPELNKYLSDKNIVDICCGVAHSLVLTIDGQVYTWGWNKYGQIGNGNKIFAVSIPYHMNGFNGEKVKAIACGYHHSIALTEKGIVSTWGRNDCGQLGFKKVKKDDLINAPKFIEINKIFVKISCGYKHSLLLSCDGDIYVFGRNDCGQLGDETIKVQSEIPLKLKGENKFIDIASYWRNSISMALSKDGNVFIWGKCGEVIKTPIETQFKSFDKVFDHYEQITYKTKVIKEKIGKGKYSEEFIEHKIIASGKFGIVCEAENKTNNKFYAIKKIPINHMIRERVIKEVEILCQLKSEFVLKLESFWIENNYIKTDGHRHCENISSAHIVFNPHNSLLLHIQMELCLFTLKDAISKLNHELNQKPFKIMSPLGYYISSELFIEILEAVKFLHELNPPIIHGDLKPSNILITNGLNGRFIKLSDFGLAKIYDFSGQSHTSYAAPEVMRGRNHDTKADIYSLGIIIQELFNIDFNEPTRENTKLGSKYSDLFNLTERIISPAKAKRPNCEQILSERNMWAFSSDELIRGKHFENGSKVIKTIEESFHLYFILTKLKTRYVREFKELDMIGIGRFGKVYKTFNLIDEQNYAMKKLLLIEFSDEIREKTLEQLKLLASFQSDLIVHYKNLWIENNEILYIQMELCFSNLRDTLMKKRNEFQRQEFQRMSRLEYYISSELFKEILEILNYLHKRNPPIIHRDLKPSNIMITNGLNGRFVKLADFGLSVIHEFAEQTRIQGLETFKYTVPEVLRGMTYDMKADIYILGIITQDLFDIDINTFSSNPMADSRFNGKYMKIIELILQMMSPIKNLRPSCDQILRDKSLWALDIKEIENDFSQLSSTEQTIEENFHKYFIKTKFRTLNRSISISRFDTQTMDGRVKS